MRTVLLLACLRSGGNINATAMTLVFMLSCATALCFLVLGDDLDLRGRLIYVRLPCLLLGGGKSRMAGIAPWPQLRFEHRSVVFL